MTEETQGQAPAQPPQAAQTLRSDPAFTICVNEHLELTRQQARQHGLGRSNMATLYAAARFNAHAFLINAGSDASKDRSGFLDYLGTMYRRMLNEHLDALGAERGVNVGESELAAEYAAAGYTPAQPAPDAPADDSKAG